MLLSSLHGINTPTLAHLERKDHSTVNANEIDGLQSDTVDDMLRDMVAPVLVAMEVDEKDDNLSELMFNTICTKFFPSKKSFPGPCKVCTVRHDTDAYRVRGTFFLPEWLLMNVTQYNSVHTDKSNVTPPNIPPPPRKPSFGSANNRLEKRNMKVVWDDLEFAPMCII